jgi:hypothetical protein
MQSSCRHHGSLSFVPRLPSWPATGRLVFSAVFDSAEPFGFESFDPELTTEGLKAEMLVAGRQSL